MDNIYIKRVCDGDSGSFRYFIKMYKDNAFCLAMSIVKSEQIAEEVVQDAFLKAYNGLKSFKQTSSFGTWFYKIVLNTSFAYLKENKKQILSFPGDLDKELVDESPLFRLKEEDQIYLINTALLALPANESLVLRLYYLEEESIKSVSEITGLSLSNTKVILHRARKRMFQVINKLNNQKV